MTRCELIKDANPAVVERVLSKVGLKLKVSPLIAL